MLLERVVLISVWILSVLGLILWIPREKIREAQLVFLFEQIITWLVGLIVVELKLIEYPVRELPYATRSSFSFEYFIDPAITAIFVLRYPEGKSTLSKIGWYILFPTWLTIVELLIERYTNLIKYLHWAWYWSWITQLITFYLSRQYYRYFFKKRMTKAGQSN